MSLNDFFADLMNDLSCQDMTRAYLINLFASYKFSTNDLSQENITVLFAQAKMNNDFYLLQRVADYIFWAQTVHPGHLYSTSYYEDIARISYYSCYKILNKQWLVFDELSDNFILLEKQTQNKLRTIKMI